MGAKRATRDAKIPEAGDRDAVLRAISAMGLDIWESTSDEKGEIAMACPNPRCWGRNRPGVGDPKCFIEWTCSGSPKNWICTPEGSEGTSSAATAIRKSPCDGISPGSTSFAIEWRMRQARWASDNRKSGDERDVSRSGR